MRHSARPHDNLFLCKNICAAFSVHFCMCLTSLFILLHGTTCTPQALTCLLSMSPCIVSLLRLDVNITEVMNISRSHFTKSSPMHVVISSHCFPTSPGKNSPYPRGKCRESVGKALGKSGIGASSGKVLPLSDQVGTYMWC